MGAKATSQQPRQMIQLDSNNNRSWKTTTLLKKVMPTSHHYRPPKAHPDLTFPKQSQKYPKKSETSEMKS
eukprot:5382188-Amphidinium_carterae.1